MKKTICFAYYGDGKFMGWYSDSFGTITENKPKLYSYSPEQVDIIRKNFQHKLKKEKSNLGEHIAPLKILDNSLAYDSSILSQYENVELRIVECPVYEGKNPNFDEERHKNWRAYNRKPFYEPGNEHYIYADYALVKAWASEEPTVFIETIFNTY